MTSHHPEKGMSQGVKGDDYYAGQAHFHDYKNIIVHNIYTEVSVEFAHPIPTG